MLHEHQKEVHWIHLPLLPDSVFNDTSAIHATDLPSNKPVEINLFHGSFVHPSEVLLRTMTKELGNHHAPGSA